MEAKGSLCAECRDKVRIPSGKLVWEPTSAKDVGNRTLSEQLGKFTCEHPPVPPDAAGTGTLVVVIATTRGHRLTWASFQRFVMTPLEADLALAVSDIALPDGVKNNFLGHAKYVWRVADPPNNDYGLYYNDIGLACFGRGFPPESAQYISRAFPYQWMGLILHSGQQAGSGALQFFRWLALYGLERDGLLKQYRHIVITRSDYLYMRPHPPVHHIKPGELMLPEGEDYDGITDRHTVMHVADAPRVLRISEMMVWGSKEEVVEYYRKHIFTRFKSFNLEKVLLSWYTYLGMNITRFPPTAFVVMDEYDGMKQRWKRSRNDDVHDPLVPVPLHPKYHHEYDKIMKNLRHSKHRL